ncbi:MAG TPA: hypothetical protein VFU46_13815 [Gemmatimonadales bacterium]|nr:hypothetical protein [Gemmatimonadales bacterium]
MRRSRSFDEPPGTSAWQAAPAWLRDFVRLLPPGPGHLTSRPDAVA